ncbi:FAD-dependent monooxygenase [Streptomyces sp. NPDC052043]|uniref:FAD-dependent monooxygenase n=1 Tax=Streptomyces sp. NPDC052043 TaxID=3365684 RepID=UPI0037D4E69F
MNSGSLTEQRITVLGGGIGGLATAAFLHQAGLRCTVYEQAPALTEVGAGLVVAPNAVKLLRRLGVMDQFCAQAVRMDVGWEFRRWADGQVLSAEDLATSSKRLFGEHTYTAHRADLLGVIKSKVPIDFLRLGERCVEADLSGPRPRLRFQNGDVVETDVLIGADGAHSVVRQAIATGTPAVFSGICAFRALVPAAEAPALARRRSHTLWIGPDHHLVHYPVSAGKYINLVAFAPAGDYTVESWSATATTEELLAEFEGWDSRLTDLIKAADSPGRWALLDRDPLERWSIGTTTLLGDAAHPMFPFFAQGSAQAIEDAAVIARCLAEDPDPSQALRRYEDLRRPRTTRLQQQSHARAHINHLPDGDEQQARDAAYAQADPLATNSWIYSYDA